jgi:formylglycine-generating enzyme required for sulfatase activity
MGRQAPNGTLVNGCGAECTAWGRKNGVDLSAMFGDVWEWTVDRYGAYRARTKNLPAPRAATSASSAAGWNTSLATCPRPSCRWRDVPDARSCVVGFRCAKSLTR